MENATFWENMQTLEHSASTIEKNYKAFVSAASKFNNNFTYQYPVQYHAEIPVRSLNDAMWNTMSTTQRYIFVTIIRGINGSLTIIIGLGDTSTIMPLWQQWWIPTPMLREMMMNQ
jgi:hypothetical protein